MARDKKDLAERKKMLKQIMAEKREKSNKRKAGNADEDAMALASAHSREQLEKMLVEAEEALDGMVEDGDNTADAISLRRSGLIG